jgi:hypothetical protein
MTNHRVSQGHIQRFKGQVIDFSLERMGRYNNKDEDLVEILTKMVNG